MAIDFPSRAFSSSLLLARKSKRISLLAIKKTRKGNGYFAGTYPGGITTVDGAPSIATVRAIVRTASPEMDGHVVAEVQSLADGTWRISNIDTSLKYDIVGRKDGFNDVIMASVSPAVE